MSNDDYEIPEEIQQEDGYVINEEVAKRTPCKCMKIELSGKTIMLCWSKGIIGVLSKDQIEKYCPEIEYIPPSQKMRKRLELFARIAKETAGLPLRERIRIMKEMLSAKKS